jgi:ElaB/YqjD/DUF883 family membrane-anchored ribosome-binding protein
VITVAESANWSVIKNPADPVITDQFGNTWDMNNQHRLVVNGQMDRGASYVQEIAYVTQLIWIFVGQWWWKLHPNDTWNLSATPPPPATIVPPLVDPRIDQIVASLQSLTDKVDQIMASLADIKTELDSLQAAEQKLEALAVATQTSLASVQTQLDAAIANAADPAALQAIADEITTMQAGVAAALPAAPVVPTTPPATPATP